jgi:hypothetical protein
VENLSAAHPTDLGPKGACAFKRCEFFTNLMGFTSKKLPNTVFFKMFVKNVFHKTVLNLNSITSQKECNYFFAYEKTKNEKFYADFKSVELIGNKCTCKKLLAKNFSKLVIEKGTNSKC